MREHITTSMEIPTLQRLSPAEKARQRRQEEIQALSDTTEQPSGGPAQEVLANGRAKRRPGTEESSKPFFVKVATRLPPDLVEWLKEQVMEYRRRNPHAPRLTIEELFRIALVDLRAKGPVDKMVARYRAIVSSF
jgi:hypothetical protein